MYKKINSSYQCLTANNFSEYYTVATETYIMFHLALTDAAAYYCLKRSKIKKKYFINKQQQEYAGNIWQNERPGEKLMKAPYFYHKQSTHKLNYIS